MKGEFEARVVPRRLPLSSSAIKALRHLDRYDGIVFTSKNARSFFEKELRRRRIALPRLNYLQVGPRNDLLKLNLKGKRVLFPRSALAPFDIVRSLRKKEVVVRVISLYTVQGAPLSRSEKQRLLDGAAERLYFKSPSGIHGLLRQFRKNEHKKLLAIPARCIGQTTAKAARYAGFKKVFIR